MLEVSDLGLLQRKGPICRERMTLRNQESSVNPLLCLYFLMLN